MRRTRVLLVDCSRPLQPEHRLIYDTHHPPVGLLSLATYLRASDLGDRVDVRIIDSTIDYSSYEELGEIVTDYAPDVVGLRCLHYHTRQFHWLSAFCKQLKNPPLVVGGGPYVSGAAAHVLGSDRAVDVVCVGEGETTFHDLVSVVHHGGDVTSVPGLHYWSGAAMKSTPERPLVDNLDTLPYPDWTRIDLTKYEKLLGQAPILRRQVPMETSRGCPYRCTYCHELFQKTFRTRSPEHVVGELELLYSLGVRDVTIIDDIFNLYPDRVIRIFDLLARKNISMRFYYPNGLRGDRMTHDAVDAMVDGGSVLFTYALESGSSRIQKFTKKLLRLDPFADAVHYTIAKGVMVDMFLMTGFPTETLAEAESTIDFLMQFDVVCMPYLNVVNAFPGTELFDWLSSVAGTAGKTLPIPDDDFYKGYSVYNLPAEIPVTSLSQQEISYLKTRLLADYVLVRPRLEKALAVQARYLSEEEILAKYRSYFPGLQHLDELRRKSFAREWQPRAFTPASAPSASVSVSHS